jgi:acyl-CoA thioester hydrolase
MPRIKLDLPEKFNFSTNLHVRISDINYGNHLGNDALLSLIHEARLRFLKSMGYSEGDIDGIGLIMADSAIVYKSEGFHGDRLTIEVSVQDITRSFCDFIYKIANKKTGKEVARAKTGLIFYDYTKKKIVRVPEKFKALYTDNEI